MNPLIATALVSIGHNLLERVLPHTPKLREAANETSSFKNQLDALSANANTDLVHYLKANGITDLSQLKNHLFHLESKLINEPEIFSLLKDAGGRRGISLSVAPGKQIKLMTSNGEEKIILPGSNAAQLAEKIHQLHSLSQLYQNEPGRSLRQIANQVSDRPLENAIWNFS